MARQEAFGYPGSLRAARKRKNLSTVDVEFLTSQQWGPTEGRRISSSTITNLERGKRQPSEQMLKDLAAVYGVEVDELGHILGEGEQICGTCRGFGTVATARRVA